MRARHKPWADDFLKENTAIVELNPASRKGNWKQEISDGKPIHLEIGTGKGSFIDGMAANYPSVQFVGMELVKSIIVSAVEKVKNTGRSNVTFINENAEKLTEIFAENEVDQLFLNFSDPWPKNRHEKRRLTFHTFLSQYQQILKPGGQLVMKSDNRGLFEYSLVSLSQFGCTLEEVTFDLHQLDDPMNVMTEYEEKFSAKGQPIYRCRVSFPK
ncbi:tRNA (guanosine(46)-N7)-methyltransferase TrmB [Gracilibacillus caseinilyticus]|uniref:tRNA (guanine-N(7)-)-methyltransferase n=1 Tax=Gracilibacillus caseinilyticus TaxID=2932256 RepID=A0ABY4ETL2_9BACI|nr:tRNA (guanosine(46)-N7)-methyltransferase TrmB [Gracilibacillus caseinilyticus]UOQ47102.1 tRNA (guanosine(46)-N7)-methyltransferase TrmB [Gracilibacillus caseinilyticus]